MEELLEGHVIGGYSLWEKRHLGFVMIPYHPDDGCEFSSSCFTCPLPRCKDDDPGWKKRHDRRLRNIAIRRLWKKGESVKAIASTVGLSRSRVGDIVNGRHNNRSS